MKIKQNLSQKYFTRILNSINLQIVVGILFLSDRIVSASPEIFSDVSTLGFIMILLAINHGVLLNRYKKLILK
ncbi:MAG: hypothetical protein LAT83_12075 [Kiritimatiellae bacterium]|nr:hypothetical protein [Kiritimatiellia bacterium]